MLGDQAGRQAGALGAIAPSGASLCTLWKFSLELPRPNPNTPLSNEKQVWEVGGSYWNPRA